MAVAFLSMSILRNLVPSSDVSSTTPFPLIMKISPSHFPQGPKFSPRPSVQPLFTIVATFYSVRIRFFITVLKQIAGVDPMTAPLSPAIRGGFYAEPNGSQACRYESQVSRTQVTNSRRLSVRTFNTSADPNGQSSPLTQPPLPFSPDTANTVGDPALV